VPRQARSKSGQAPVGGQPPASPLPMPATGGGSAYLAASAALLALPHACHHAEAPLYLLHAGDGKGGGPAPAWMPPLPWPGLRRLRCRGAACCDASQLIGRAQ
jgi:hypothetical protein